ncbi:MAG: DUF882 domain-containing protein [Xanthobacteraceae bacterium]
MPVRLAHSSRLISGRSRLGGLALATLFILFGCTSLQDAAANGETRTLSFQHTHRDDSITATFKRDGRYDEDGLKKLNYFLRDWRNDEQTKMDPRLFDILWEVSREVGAKEPIHIISSYRSPQTNAMLRRRSHGVAQYSQHMLGNAIDFFIPGVPLEQLRYAGLRLQRGGVGYYPTSGSPFVHVDVGSVRHWPRMTHDQLARVFPDGKTVHVPSDGTPLKNYQVALAEVHRRGGTASETSLNAARSAGIQTAEPGAVTPAGGRNFLAKLLGIRSDEDEDADTATPRGRQPASAAPAPARQDVAAVPMPRPRPARAGGFTLAAASTSAAQTPAHIITSRGVGDKTGNASAAPRVQEAASAPMPASPAAEPDAPEPRLALSPSGERLAWIPGPEGQSFPPRPPRDIESVAVAAADTTASITAWASDPGQNDQVPSELALAYAANQQAEQAASPAAAPMGPLGPAAPSSAGNATVATRKPAANSPAAKIAPRMDPWLRGIVMTPSVHHSLRVATVGTQDSRTLRPLLQKPRTTLAMVFSNDPLLGITSVQFSGPAVAFLPTISYATRTAGLN